MKIPLIVKNISALVAFLILAGCMASANMVRPSENGPDFNNEAIVVFKLYGKSRSMKESYFVETVFQEIGSPSHFVRFPNIEKNEVFHIKEGKYYISVLAASEVVLNTEARDPNFNRDTSIPVMPIEIKAGEVLYLGTLVANGIPHNSIMTRKNDIVSFEVIDESEQAKIELEETYPGFGERMQTELFQLVN